MANAKRSPHLNLSLVEEFEATLTLVRELREAVAKEPLLDTKRGGDKMNPAATILSQQQTHLRGLARLIQKQGADLPTVEDAELEGLLD